MPQLPTLRWGIIGTGQISSWFTSDLVLNRPSAKAIHKVVAIGARSVEKAEKFKKDFKIPDSAFVGSYEEVYDHKDVDIVYIGLPHVFHKENALRAIAKGKHVLVEKPATINAKEFKELVEAAKKHKVFLMEAVWLRFRPLILEVQQKLFKDKELGEIYRLFVDYGADLKVDSLSDDSRLKQNALGAGALLDIGIYTATYARLLLDDKIGKDHTPFDIKAFQTINNDIDYYSTAILKYQGTQRQAVITSTLYNDSPYEFLKLDGELGSLTISAFHIGAAAPSKYKIEYKDPAKETFEKEFPTFHEHGYGFFYEQDAVALDIAAGKLQDDLVPWDESILVLETLDEIRRQGGLVYPQDK